ncbi:MAG TPA: GNAT family N-acetyltransferase [Pirellulales bacterium]|nr:GNAT family N-acetyltransferase [Pirellulales bacterium]
MLIRAMTVDDLPSGLRLSRAAGWNQTPDDWQTMLALAGNGAFVAVAASQVIGTTMVCRFERAGWVAMVLVDERFRRQGIGRRLVEHALRLADEAGIETLALDATPLGRPLYEQLGFTVESEFSRYIGQPKLEAEGDGFVMRPIDAADLDAIVAIDRHAIGCDRRRLFERWFSTPAVEGMVCVVDGRVRGFAFHRPGAVARHIGPCMADDESIGQALLKRALRDAAACNVYVDAPRNHPSAIAIAEAAGLNYQRPFWRMRRGPGQIASLETVWATSGPEKA